MMVVLVAAMIRLECWLVRVGQSKVLPRAKKAVICAGESAGLALYAGWLTTIVCAWVGIVVVVTSAGFAGVGGLVRVLIGYVR